MRWLALALLAWMAQPAAAALPPPARTPQPEADVPQAPRDADWAPFRLLEGKAQYLDAAIRATQAPKPETRRGGLLALGMLGLPEGTAPARRCLHDPERLVRMQAAVTLTLLYERDGLAGATVALREGPDWLQFYALYGLWRLHSEASGRALRASRPTLTGFLLKTLDRALAAPPRRRCNTLRSGTPDPKLSLYQLWGKVSDAFVTEGDLWWHEGDYDQSIRCQWTALFYDPEYVDLYTNIAWLQWSMGRHGEAIRTYHRCLAANPFSWEAAQALGEYYWRHGHKQIAVRYFQRAADCHSPAIPRRMLGHAYRDLGEAEKAVCVWQVILEMDPNDPIAQRELERARKH